jgi:hypothetical protein
MIDNISQLLSVLGFIGSKLTQKTHVYLIGGSALIYHHLKDRTKDIDIVCSYEEANRIVSALRPHGTVESIIGIVEVHFLRVFLKNFILEIFIRDVWVGGEYDMLEATQCDILNFGDLEVRIPDPKTIIKIKDSHIEALRSDWQRDRSEIVDGGEK